MKRAPDGQRLIGLELLRFVAAVGVLVWHYQHFMFTGVDQTAWDVDRLPYHWLFAPFYLYGYEGVELFWCISGFIFTWKYGAAISRSAMPFRRFALLRFSRLYPLQVTTLLMVAALQWLYTEQHGQPFVYLYNDVAHFLMNLFLANWWGFQSGESFNGPSWSVSAEILIYLVFFLVTRRMGSRWLVDVLALIGFSAGAWIIRSSTGIELTFTGAGTFFYLGSITYRFYRWIDARVPLWRDRVSMACTGLIALFALLVGLDVLKIAGASLVMFPAAVLLAQLAVRPKGPWARALLIRLGNLTYASYMLHFPLQLCLMLILGACSVSAQPLVYTDWFMLAYLGAVLITASLVFRWFEQPAQAWLRNLGQPQHATMVPWPQIRARSYTLSRKLRLGVVRPRYMARLIRFQRRN